MCNLSKKKEKNIIYCISMVFFARQSAEKVLKTFLPMVTIKLYLTSFCICSSKRDEEILLALLDKGFSWYRSSFQASEI